MQRKTFVTENSIDSSASAGQIMERIRRPASWPGWQSEILSTEGPQRLSEGDVVAGKAAMLGFEVDGQSLTVEAADDRYVEEVVVGVGMRVAYTVAPAGSGSRVTHRLECELPGGPLGGLLSFFLKRRFVKMERELLKRLASTGESSDARRGPSSD